MATDLHAVFAQIDLSKASKPKTAFIQYGTAGFRTLSDGFDYVVYRVGLLAALRSKFLGSKTIGLMITASHNPEQDNGVKLVDPKGEMLEASWEGLATRIANASDEDLTAVLIDIVNTAAISWDTSAIVYIGRDTRSSSPRLSEAAKSAIEALGGTVIDYGIVTTPMLHFFVAEVNSRSNKNPPSDEEYFGKLSSAFFKLNDKPITGNYSPVLHFDGANGVGAIAMERLKDALNNCLDIKIFNSGNGRLNYMCGSDFVKVNQKAPDGVPIDADVRSVSVDGDADRLIYFSLSKERNLHLMDGDRVGTLLAAYLMDLLKASGLQLNIGLVHTAYANSAATEYISQVLKVPLACTATGVKYLHHKALEFDIGVYFEANGHGTVVYKESAVQLIKSTASSPDASEEVKAAGTRLSNFIDLTNQAVGDALSDLLLVETVLRDRGWGIYDWEKSYTDYPNQLLKVTIKDRDAVTTTSDARICLTPLGLQEEIDRLVANYKNGRAFVRASGTEDVVRVYAEAATKEGAEKLGAEVSLAVFQLANGVGDLPVVPS